MPDKGECGHARKYHTDVGEEKRPEERWRKNKKNIVKEDYGGGGNLTVQY